jgi:hypothetical protein
VGNLVFSGRIKPKKKVLDEPTTKTLRPLLLGIDISTNNIAIGLVRVCEIRFQPTKYIFVHSFSWSSEPANAAMNSSIASDTNQTEANRERLGFPLHHRAR